MIKEWQLVEAQRDASHAFIATRDTANCGACGRPRCLHTYDGFLPLPSPAVTPEQNRWLRHNAYRVHPGFTRPGSFSALERAEMAKEKAAQRKVIERALAEDQAKFKSKAQG